MELSKYIKLVLDNSQAKEIGLDVRLNQFGFVDDTGPHKVSLKLTRK